MPLIFPFVPIKFHRIHNIGWNFNLLTELSCPQISSPKFQGNRFCFSMTWKKQIYVARLPGVFPAKSRGMCRFRCEKSNILGQQRKPVVAKHLGLCLQIDCFSLLPVWILRCSDQQLGWMSVCVCLCVCVFGANSLARMCGEACWILIQCLLFCYFIPTSAWMDGCNWIWIYCCVLIYSVHWQLKVLWWVWWIFKVALHARFSLKGFVFNRGANVLNPSNIFTITCQGLGARHTPNAVFALHLLTASRTTLTTKWLVSLSSWMTWW